MNNLESRLPKSWADIEVEQYIELTTIAEEEEIENSFDLILEQLAILLDTSSDDPIIEDIDIDELDNLMSKIKWLRDCPKSPPKKNIGKYELKDWINLILAEYIELEHYFNDNYLTKLPFICATVYKQYEQDKWGNKIEEPHIYDREERSNEFRYIPISDVYNIIDSYLNWKKNFIKVYENLMEEQGFLEIENEDELDPQELKALKKEIDEDKRKVKFNWELILWNLSGGDITKYSEILDQKLITVMNTLSMKKSLNI